MLDWYYTVVICSHTTVLTNKLKVCMLTVCKHCLCFEHFTLSTQPTSSYSSRLLCTYAMRQHNTNKNSNGHQIVVVIAEH